MPQFKNSKLRYKMELYIKNIIYTLSFIMGLVSCNGGGTIERRTSLATDYPPNPTNVLPNGYLCLPQLPSTTNGIEHNFQIAYGENCQVSAIESSDDKKTTLQSMAVALSFGPESSPYAGSRYCSGTPLSFDPITKTGFILTAAHCVLMRSTKAENQQITPDNITTFETALDGITSMAYVNQIDDSHYGSGVTGSIEAVYVPKQYCQIPAFEKGICSNLSAQNGDIALIKAKFTESQQLQYNPNVKLATLNLEPKTPSYIMALGYGMTNNDERNTNLFYISYEYFASNSYWEESGESVIMNGYSQYGSNIFSSIICGGDSGGGDFYWENNTWYLLGVHSYTSRGCGTSSPEYYNALDASADVRPFSAELQNIMLQDTSQKGCGYNSKDFICKDNTRGG